MSEEDELFEQVGRLVGSRPGWHYEPSTTPGGVPSWCLDPDGEISLSVTVIEGQIAVYLPDSDTEIPLPDLDALSAWVEANQARFLRR